MTTLIQILLFLSAGWILHSMYFPSKKRIVKIRNKKLHKMLFGKKERNLGVKLITENNLKILSPFLFSDKIPLNIHLKHSGSGW